MTMLLEQIIMELEQNKFLKVAYLTYEGGFERVAEIVYRASDPFIALDTLPPGIAREEIREGMHFACNTHGFWMRKNHTIQHLPDMTDKELIILFEYLIRRAEKEIDQPNYVGEPRGEMAQDSVDHNEYIESQTMPYDLFVDHPIANALLHELQKRADYDCFTTKQRKQISRHMTDGPALRALKDADNREIQVAANKQHRELLDKQLIERAAIYFTGWKISTVEEVEKTMSKIYKTKWYLTERRDDGKWNVLLHLGSFRTETLASQRTYHWPNRNEPAEHRPEFEGKRISTVKGARILEMPNRFVTPNKEA